MSWQDFEIDCIRQLTNRYAARGVRFQLTGASNATTSDIYVTTASGDTFYIEVKANPAQSGQFVVWQSHDYFRFSSRNKDHHNPISQRIITTMNQHFDEYKNPGTTGRTLSLPTQTCVDWVTCHYRNKGVRFLISHTNTGQLVIVPLKKLAAYFSLTATYRVKRSGSSVPSRRNLPEITQLIADPAATFLRQPGSQKLLVTTTRHSAGTKLVGDRYRYQLNHLTDQTFEIRQLSHTANANVIFSIQLQKNQDPADVAAFAASLL